MGVDSHWRLNHEEKNAKRKLVETEENKVSPADSYELNVRRKTPFVVMGKARD